MAFRTNKMPVLQEKSASGSVATFNTALAMPLASCTSLISGYQEGSGTPSPDNVRPLHAFSSANIVNVSDYGSWFRGIYQGIYGFVDLGSLNWNYQATYHYMYARLNGGKYTNSSVGLNGLCSLYEVDATNSYSSLPDKCMIVGSDFVTINVCSVVVNDSSYTDANAFKAAMNGVYLIYELATPTTPTITPEQFATLCQAFGITGNTYTFTFGQSIYQGYIDWLKGVAVGTRKKLVLTSSINWGKSTSYPGAYYLWWTLLDEAGKVNGPFICDRAKTVMSTSEYVYGTCYSDSTGGIRLMPENSTIQDWLDYLDAQVSAGTPVTIAYELAEPIEIPLGGINLLTQEGQNNIFADTGDVDLTYKDLDIAKRGNFREVFRLPS